LAQSSVVVPAAAIASTQSSVVVPAAGFETSSVPVPQQFPGKSSIQVRGAVPLAPVWPQSIQTQAQPARVQVGRVIVDPAWDQENPRDAFERLNNAESGLLLSLRNAELMLAKLDHPLRGSF
jgi:hypothetical protein